MTDASQWIAPLLLTLDLRVGGAREPSRAEKVSIDHATGMGKGQLACPAAYGPSSVLEERESRCRNG